MWKIMIGCNCQGRNNAMNVKNILQEHEITLAKFAQLLDISRPTLNVYIRDYEYGKELPNKGIQLLFDQLFMKPLTEEDFRKIISKYTSVRNRQAHVVNRRDENDRRNMYIELSKLIRKDLNSNDFDMNIYLFINLLITGYKSDPLFKHVARYFLVLNGIVSLENVDLEQESYLAHYFDVLDRDNRGLLGCDSRKTDKFINRIHEIEIQKKLSEKEVQRHISKRLAEKINQLHQLGVKIDYDDFLDEIIDKICDEQLKF